MDLHVFRGSNLGGFVQVDRLESQLGSRLASTVCESSRARDRSTQNAGRELSYGPAVTVRIDLAADAGDNNLPTLERCDSKPSSQVEPVRARNDGRSQFDGAGSHTGTGSAAGLDLRGPL